MNHINKNNKIRCLFTAVEADPLVKVGGLGDVAFALPQALRKINPDEIEGSSIDVRLVIPCHSTACSIAKHSKNRINFEVETPAGKIPATAISLEINDLPIYLISSPLIPEDSSVYSTDNYRDGLKFSFFSLATLTLARALDWQPDILHANDWHTALSVYLANIEKEKHQFFQDTKTILTIHNLPFMGGGTEKAIEELGIPFSHDPHLPKWARKLPLPMGLSASDKIVAVSPTYAREILTPDFGCSLERFFETKRETLTGIINGIDIDTWDPLTDQALFARYSKNDLSERYRNKHVLQNEFNLAVNPDIPLLTYIGRMDQQKGVDLVFEALKICWDHEWQAIILGTGNSILEKQAKQLEEEYPDKVRSFIRFDSKLSRMLYGGSDILLMPSRYEPCGLAQMIAMRYGCIPIARATGGLQDTITEIQMDGKGTGFLFKTSTALDLAKTLASALKKYTNKSKWTVWQQNGMSKDFSWENSALDYAKIYLDLIRR